MIPETNTKKKSEPTVTWPSDILALGFLLATGWFLIGWYADFEYLFTGYQDWIYHSFRIRSILEQGVVSWDHIWSNGINYWRAYQYLPHVAVIGVMAAFQLSIGKAMLVTSVAVFLAARVALYALLRGLGVSPLVALIAAMCTYLFPQQWVALKDYSLFLSIIFVYPFLYFWIGSFSDRRYLYVATALAGFFWSIHPVLGYTLSGLLFFGLVFSEKRKELWLLFRIGVLFLLSSAAFSAPYLSVKYKFVNPFFTSQQFLKDTIVNDFFGLGLTFMLLFGLAGGALFFFGHRFPQWSKVLYLYCAIFLFLIRLGQENYLPNIINQLQISRALIFIALLLAACFGIFFSRIIVSWRSKFTTSILLVVLVFFAANSTSVSQVYSGSPVPEVKNAVAEYFRDHPLPAGGVYITNVSEASFLAPSSIRYATSYNEHLQPHPYSTRFHNLVRTDAAYAVITEKQKNLIANYTLVLGIEYLFLPAYSPLIKGLTEGEGARFEVAGDVTGTGESFTAVRSRQQIAHAYAFEASEKRLLLRFDELPKPTLATASYAPWDDEIARMADIIREGRVRAVPAAFPSAETVTVDLRSLPFKSPAVFLTESADPDWRVETGSASIEPTSLRFMAIESATSSRLPDELRLVHTWPKWHWSLQIGVISFVTFVLVVFVITEIVRLWKRRK